MEQQPPHHSFLHYGHGHQPAWMAGYHGMVPLGAAPWGNRSLSGTPVTASQSPSLSVGYSATPDEELTYRRVNSVASFASPTGRMSSPLWGHSDNAAAMVGGFPPRHFVESPSPLMMGGVASPEFHGERASQWSALPSPSAAHSHRHHGIGVGAVSLDDADHEPQFEECEDLPSARSTPPRPTSTASRHSDGSDEIYVGAFVEDAMDAETDSGDEVVGITDDGNLIYRRKKKSKTVVAPQAAIAAPVAVPAAAAIATPEPIAAEVAVEEDDVESDDEVVGITDDGELIYRRAVKPAPAVSETATEPQYHPSRGSTPVDVMMPHHQHEVPSHDDSLHGMRFSAPRPFAVSPEQQPAVDPLVAKLLLLKLRDRNRENDPGAHYQQRELRTVEHQLAAVGRERRQQVAAAIDVSALPR